MITDNDFSRWAKNLMSEMNVKYDPLREEVVVNVLRRVFELGVDDGRTWVLEFLGEDK